MIEIFERLKKSKATGIIILLNLVVFIMVVANGGFNSSNLVRFGASNSDLILQGQYYRVFTQLFVHHSYFHFIFNMVVIYMMAPSIENKFGPHVLIGVFLLAGLVDELLSFIVLDKWEASGGASTGYFALYGLAIGTLFFYKDEDLQRWASSFILPMVFVMLASEIYFRIRSGSPDSIFAYSKSHVTGLLVGLILSGIFPPKGYKLDKRIRAFFVTFFVGLLVLLFFYLFKKSKC